MPDHLTIDNTLPHFEGFSNASFGELLQGVGTDNDDFLITLPIDLHSKACFYPDAALGNITVFPKYKSKVKKFIETFLDKFGFTASGNIVITSDIPEGKGLSSSTADMVAAFRCMQNYLQVDIELEKVGQILREIEPSDGVLYAGSVIYKHKKCLFQKSLGVFPTTHIIAIDEGGVLDTISYNKVKKDYSIEEKTMYSLLRDDMADAFEKKDYNRVGFIAMQSALMNQKYNNKKNLINCISMLGQLGAMGLVTTHSGTCIGIILDPEKNNVDAAYQLIKQTFPEDNIFTYKTI